MSAEMQACVAKLSTLTRRSFCITDLEALLAADTDYPIIQIIHRATGSYGGTCVLGGLLILLLFFSTVTTVAKTSLGLQPRSWIPFFVLD